MPLTWIENYNLLIFDQIDSTNNEAFRLIKNGIKGNFVIVAREQTAGKGSNKRSWESILGNLHMSILIQPIVSISRIKELSFLVAVVLHKTIKKFIINSNASKTDIQLKWPNDILIDDKKLAGILIESTCLNGVNYVVIGIGVNTHFIPDVKNADVTSLFNEGIILKNSDCFLSSFMNNFHANYFRWISDDNFNNIRKEWLKLAYNLNNIVTLDNGISKISGIFKGIDQEGAICIETVEKLLLSFSSGQLTFSK
jgi:BirA family biotin operon repressor/biotin-[acetyl-CoA-carboxylase] ligase